jgi:hypothetical protein
MWSRTQWTKDLAIGAIALATAGCGVASSKSLPADSAPCARTAAPLTAAHVAGALRRHGFRNVRITNASCATQSADALINRDVVSGELLDCAVYGPGTSWGHSIRTKGPAPHSSVMWHGVKAYLFFENMECQLYPERGHEARQMAALVGAAHDLQKQLRRG